MSNSLDPDQARRLVGPDLGPNCLQTLSADDTSRQRVKMIYSRFTKYFPNIEQCLKESDLTISKSHYLFSLYKHGGEACHLK